MASGCPVASTVVPTLLMARCGAVPGRGPHRSTAVHLAAAGFSGAPRPLGRDQQGREVLTFLEGQTVGETRPWPGWVHSDTALEQVADWLSGYHRAVADFVPPADAVWREGVHGDPDRSLRMATRGHTTPSGTLRAWSASWTGTWPARRRERRTLHGRRFLWVPLHARRVVAAEGFTAFGQRRKRLEAFLARYGWDGRPATFWISSLPASRNSYTPCGKAPPRVTLPTSGCCRSDATMTCGRR